MEDSAKVQVDLSVLPWVEDAVGARLLAYLLGCDVDRLPSIISGDRAITQKQADVIATFSNLRRSIPEEIDQAAHKDILSGWLTQVANGTSVARSIHEHAKSEEMVPSGLDDLEAALAQLALDAYPAFLLPPDRLPFDVPMMDDTSSRLYSLLFRHPQTAAFSAAALRDPVLQAVFESENEHAGRSAMLYRNTGTGGGLQLSMLPDMILRSAWRHLQGTDPSTGELVDGAIEELQLVYDVLAGKSRTIPAKIAFTGILLPPDGQLDIGQGVIRSVREQDRRYVPDSLKGQLTGTDASGKTALINYDGDVLLEYKFPYRARVARPGQEVSASWPQDINASIALERTLIRLRFSLMLAVEREFRVQLVPTWRYFDEPVNPGWAMSWSDPRHGPGIMPTQLTEGEMITWGEWYERLSTPDVDRIELALTRILRAIAERREPSDVLIDSVIAWENLFGTSQGEPTFRVTMSIAALLEESLEAREVLRKNLAKIYRLRSRIVHGSGSLGQDEYPRCQEALDIAIRAVRELVAERIDILRLGNGAERSTKLLLGNLPTAPPNHRAS